MGCPTHSFTHGGTWRSGSLAIAARLSWCTRVRLAPTLENLLCERLLRLKGTFGVAQDKSRWARRSKCSTSLDSCHTWKQGPKFSRSTFEGIPRCPLWAERGLGIEFAHRRRLDSNIQDFFSSNAYQQRVAAFRCGPWLHRVGRPQRWWRRRKWARRQHKSQTTG